jgi:hypothetical protein
VLEGDFWSKGTILSCQNFILYEVCTLTTVANRSTECVHGEVPAMQHLAETEVCQLEVRLLVLQFVQKILGF